MKKVKRIRAKIPIDNKKSIRASCALLCVVFAISTIKTQQTKRYQEGQLQSFATGTPVPTSTAFTQSATPISSQSIKGTLYTDFNEANSYLKFKVYYRNNSDNSSPKESLLLEFYAPYRLEETYQNQTLLYTDQAVGTNFHLNSTGLRLYDLDDDFYTFRGDDITNSMTLKP